MLEENCYKRAAQIYGALVKLTNQEIRGVRYFTVDLLQSPFFLQRDDNNRFEIASNVEVMKALSAVDS